MTPRTKEFFSRYSISTDFLSKNPSTWKYDPSYKAGFDKLKNISVVNDVAERGVKLIHDYNNILTNDESEKQYVLQVVAQSRKTFPNATKYSLIKR